jgi:monovalent cation/hydrogen antiporter
MDGFQTFIMLMFAAAVIVGITQKIRIPYPVGLILGGAAIGFNPYQPQIYYDPNLILGIVLPPVLYHAAFGISFQEFKRNWKDILSLAFGLVAFTTLVLGIIFKWLFPEFSWALAFAFGAIISPPDVIAVTSILKRFSISPRLTAILEGESLVNDSSALILYRLAVIALLSGTFSLYEGSIEFTRIVTGGISIGIITGYILQKFSRAYLDPVVAIVFSFSIPYITYIFADYFGVSGVLAVVVNGLIGSQIVLRHHSSLRRVLGHATWDIFIILMNCFVFILIGLQLRTVGNALSGAQMLLYVQYAIFITFVMIAIRMMWVYAKNSVSYVQLLNNPKLCHLCPQIVLESTLIGWSGMRGIVSLAAALALPYTLPSGTPLEGRNEVVFISFCVIMLSLLIPGLTLGPLIDWLKIHHHPEPHHEIKVKNQLAKVAQDTIHHLHNIQVINKSEFDFLFSYFKMQYRILEITPLSEKKLENLESARNVTIQEQRKKLLEIWERMEIDDKLLHQLEHELDLDELHILRAELK